MSIRTRLVVFFFVIILVVALVMGIYQTRLLDRFFRSMASQQMAVQATRLEPLVRNLNVVPEDNRITRQLISWASSITGSRVLLVDLQGVIVADSETGPRSLAGQVLDPPSIGSLIRERKPAHFNITALGRDSVGVAVPWWTSGEITGAMILARSLGATEVQTTRQVMGFVVRAGLWAAGVSAMLAYVLSSRIAGPLKKMSDAARSISKGDFSQRLSEEHDDELGELARAINTMSSEISRLVANLTDEKDKLQRLMDERQKMLSDISHDLRTPVTSIKGFVEALQDGMVKTDEDKRRALGIIHDEAERLSRLVNDLFYLTRLESGDLPFDMADIDLGSVIRDSLAKMEPIASERSLRFAVSAANAQVRVHGSRDRLVQAILNILDNAIKYSPIGGTVSVSLSTRSTPDRGVVAVLSVSDQGPGIPREDLPHIFERFYRADKSRSRAKAGAGLGLSIAKFIVEKHNGSLTVESTVGQGSTFVMTLPVTRVAG